MTALVGIVGDEVVAVGGVAHVRGMLVAFLDLDDKARRYKVAMVRAGKKIIERARGKVVVAQADPKETATSRRWLESMGFIRMNETGLYRLRDG